jgi:hypothetical protein
MAAGGRKNADEALIMALASGATVETAARHTGISERTAYRRLAEPTFSRGVTQIRAEMTQQTAGMLTAAATEAVSTLRGLQAKSIPASVRLGAARSVLELGAKLRETAEFEARIAALEEAAERRQP